MLMKEKYLLEGLISKDGFDVVLERIKEIEREEYPEGMWAFQDIETVDDIADEFPEYIESHDWDVISEDGWYCILGYHGNMAEIVDFAAKNRGLKLNIFKVLQTLLKNLPSKIKFLEGAMRESTSYRLVKLFPRYGFEIIEDNVFYQCGEAYHEFKAKKIKTNILDKIRSKLKI